VRRVRHHVIVRQCCRAHDVRRAAGGTRAGQRDDGLVGLIGRAESFLPARAVLTLLLQRLRGTLLASFFGFDEPLIVNIQVDDLQRVAYALQPAVDVRRRSVAPGSAARELEQLRMSSTVPSAKFRLLSLNPSRSAVVSTTSESSSGCRGTRSPPASRRRKSTVCFVPRRCRAASSPSTARCPRARAQSRRGSRATADELLAALVFFLSFFRSRAPQAGRVLRKNADLITRIVEVILVELVNLAICKKTGTAVEEECTHRFHEIDRGRGKNSAPTRRARRREHS